MTTSKHKHSPDPSSSQFEQARQAFSDWYDAKPEEAQSLVDEISDRTAYIIDEREYDDFIAELASRDIVTAEQLEVAFERECEGVPPESIKEFTKQYCDDCGLTSIVHEIVVEAVDFEKIWHKVFEHKITAFEFNRNTYFLRK